MKTTLATSTARKPAARKSSTRYSHGYVSPEQSTADAQAFGRWAREREARQNAKHGAAWVASMGKGGSEAMGKPDAPWPVASPEPTPMQGPALRVVHRDVKPANDVAMSPTADVSIEGMAGLYIITPHTPAGHAWASKHLTRGERTALAGSIACEGGDRCRDIVRAIDRDGLRVEVNGVDMRGFGGAA